MTRPPPPLRSVLMTADVVGGVFTYALELARGLAGRGVRVTLATMGGEPSGTQRESARAIPGLALHEGDFRLEWMEAPWEDVAAAGDWLLDLERRTSPDVVHLNCYAHAALPFAAPKVTVGHSCVLSWCRAVHGNDAPDDWNRYRNVVREGLHASEAVVAPTKAMLSQLVQIYGIESGTVIPNARSGDHFAPAKKEPYAMTVGRLWDQAKNVAVLDSIASDLPWPVKLVGDARGPAGGEASFFSLKSLGRLDEPALAAMLSRCSIYVHPARYEPFGLTVLEAAMSGCALVLGDLPSLRENWDGAALFVPPNDANALRRTLLDLMSDEARRAGLSARALDRAASFSTEVMTNAYLDLYRAVRERLPKEA